MDIGPEIKWNLFDSALWHYDEKGFKYIEVPWIVPRSATNITFNGTPIEVYDTVEAKGYGNKSAGDLVGSAEQSFAWMIQESKLEYGSYQTITPCFRKETKQNNLTRPYFMKLELIYFSPEYDLEIMLDEMIDDAAEFFDNESGNRSKILKTDDGYDLMLGDIEIGSYGIRKYKGHEWVYGTGLAEPRFSQAIKEYNK